MGYQYFGWILISISGLLTMPIVRYWIPHIRIISPEELIKA